MMEHIRQFDWCSSTVDRHFVEESDLDNCATEKILRNKFYDPLISSDSESEAPRNAIDWAAIEKKRDNSTRVNRLYVPGLRSVPPFPKISALTPRQHLQCLKVLCADNPQILEAEFIARPTKQDHRVFEEVKEIYAKEQVEFQEWARSLWAGSHRARVLRPRPEAEAVWAAERALRRLRARALPPAYRLAAQIPLAPRGERCTLTHLQDFINVNATELPEIRLPEMIDDRFNILRPCPSPAPCIKHPCQFVLPYEQSMSILPLTELQRELAQYALERGASCVAAESGLKCLLELDRGWTLPLAVCDVCDPEGDKCNVLVLGSELFIGREAPTMRTYRAFRHLVEHAIIPKSERMKVLNRRNNSDTKSSSDTNMNDSLNATMQADDTDSDDDRDDLYIDAECDSLDNGMETDAHDTDMLKNVENKMNGDTNGSNKEAENNGKHTKDFTKGFDEIGFYSCSCKELFVKPPPRSFKKWQVKDHDSGESYDIMVHCSHKAKCGAGEVYVEPLPEYQLDLAASQHSPHKLRSIALSLLLRRKASLLSLRIDGSSGDLVRYDRLPYDEFIRQHAAHTAGLADTAHAALAQLQGLVPGHYILQHEPEHGANALLFASRTLPGGGRTLLLEPPGTDGPVGPVGPGGPGGPGGPDQPPGEPGQDVDVEEAGVAKVPPTLTPLLLPMHKYRKVLPCAFTPHASQLWREPPRRAARPRPPPPALKLDAEHAQRATGKTGKWPKKKKKKKTAQ